MAGPRILVSPLSWGLGHATRCIPVINRLIETGAEVIPAAEGNALKILQETFPGLETINLNSAPQITYAAGNPGAFRFGIHLAKQYYKFNRSVISDFNQTQQIVKKYNIRGIISDNRFGVRHSKIPSVIISHQLSPVFKFFGPFIRIENRRRIHAFHRVWIPDFSGADNLSGRLSKPDKIRIPVSYIGILSRFSYSFNEIRDTLLIILSGPEPQRTHLEKTMVDFLLEHGNSYQRIVLIRGFSSTILPNLPNNTHVYSHLPTTLFESELKRAQVTVSRSGYSSIMDYVQCRTKAVLIPTPGQSEQEYLAHRLNGKYGFIACLNAEKIHKDINKAKESREHEFTSPNSELLNQSIQDFLTDLA